MTETVTTYDPSHGITYRHTAESARLADAMRARTMARLAHRRTVDSVSVVNYRTGAREGRDPFTGARVAWIDPVTVIPVRSEPSLLILSTDDRHAAF